ncbi:MAG: NAD(P)-binding domain-containing protein [Candidatus Dormibacteria bacterium]
MQRGCEVTVFEMGTAVGGLWVYENDNGRSPAYASLHINSEASVTSYKDFPFPPGTPLYPSHDRVRRYLESYADHFDLRRHIRFKTRVTSVLPIGDAAEGGWRVRLADGTEEDFHVVVIGTGHQSMPAHPGFKHEVAGEYLPSHDYRVPEPFRGKRVLVVGVGNSALDIASDICTVTESTTIASRSPVLIMPRMLWGMPVGRILGRVERPWVPWPVARRIRELLTQVAHGRMEQWGFTTPKTRTHPASHPSIMGHIVWDRIKVKPGVTAVAGQEVRFADGSSETFDTMIAATGYEVDMPFLPPEVSPVVGRKVNLYRRIASPDWRGLYFIGYFNVSGGANIRLMDVQCEWLAAVVDGDVELPQRDVMMAEIEEHNQRLVKRYPGTPRYGLELEPKAYGLLLGQDLTRHPVGRDQA